MREFLLELVKRVGALLLVAAAAGGRCSLFFYLAILTSDEISEIIKEGGSKGGATLFSLWRCPVRHFY